MSFPSNVKEEVFVACKRHCSLCHFFCGTKMEVHHIKPKVDGGENTFDNAIPLCFNCHADMTSYDFKHPKGNKYTKSELRQHRDEWYKIAKTLPEPQTPAPNDIAVYDKLLKLLPVNGGVDFVEHNNFTGFSFSNKRIDDLFDFDNYCRHNPAFRFLNVELEDKLNLLVSQIDKLTETIATETFPVGDGSTNHVPPEWEEEQPERFRKVVDEIHSLGKKVNATYSQLIHLAIQKLNALPPL